jgi:hypothetical protein
VPPLVAKVIFNRSLKAMLDKWDLGMGMASVWASGRGSGISPQTAHGLFIGRSGQIGCGWGNREDAGRLWADRLWLGEQGECWEALGR